MIIFIDCLDGLNKLKIGNHKFEILEDFIYFRSKEFSYINIICTKCLLENTLTITDNIDNLIETRNKWATEKGKKIQHLIKSSLFIIDDKQYFTDAVFDLTCEERIIKSIIE